MDKTSTLELLFGRCPAWDNGVLRDSIFDCKCPFSQNGLFRGDMFITHPFWKSISNRFWQIDDFSYDGIAAVAYHKIGHRFKMYFNPLEYFKYLITTGFQIDEIENVDPSIYQILFNDLVEGNPVPNIQCIISNLGWNINLYNELIKSKQYGYFTDEGWKLWCAWILNHQEVSQNIESIFIHEIMHVEWNHLVRVEKRDRKLWNYATDYSINQCVNFTPNFSKMFITKNNKWFWKKFIISVIRYICNRDDEIRKTILKDLPEIFDNDSLDTISDEDIKTLYYQYMTECVNYFNKEDKFAHKSAEYYYDILLETTLFNGGGEGKGYDPHNKWGEGQGDGEGQEEGEEEGEGNGKGNGEGEEKTSTGKSSKPSGEKQRCNGHGVGDEHAGFDGISEAEARQEVRSSIKEAIERSGIDPEDTDALEKALQRIPGLKSMGATITEWFKVKRKNWKQVLKRELSACINPSELDYTMTRENRSRPDCFPGKRRERGLDVIIQVDTSGSINHSDWNSFCGQIEEIGRSCDADKIRVLQVHHSISSDTMVNIRKIKKEKVKEVGGTNMSVGLYKLKKEKNRKTVVLFTDGYIEPELVNKNWGFNTIIFLSSGNEHNAIDLRKRGFTVICQTD